VGTTTAMHFLMNPVTDVVYSSMQSDECGNIFQSVLAKQLCSLASASSAHFRIERVTGTSVLPALVFACKQELEG
jgi:hypothetical protein